MKSARCLTVTPGQSICLQTDSGEIVLNVIECIAGSVRVEVTPQNVESVTLGAAAPRRSDGLKGKWVKHEPK